MLQKKLVALIVIISSTYGKRFCLVLLWPSAFPDKCMRSNTVISAGQTLAPRRGPPRFYAIYPNASIGNISLVNSREEILRPSQRVIIPTTCYDPLQCGIPPQQNGFSVIYIPSEENSTLILLKLEGEILYSYNITVPCIFSDFVLLQPDTEDSSLLITCELTSETNNQIRYILSGPYGNKTRDGIESVPLQHGQAVVSPIILEIYNDDEGQDVVSIVSINTQNEIVVFGAQIYELDSYPLGLDQSSCMPARIQRLRSDIAFLLTCQGGHSYLVNISAIPDISLVSLPNSVKALASNVKYSLTLTVDNSTATATIQEVSTQSSVAVRTIPQQLNAAKIFDVGFGGPDDKFAYLATDGKIIFIDVKMGLEGAEQFTHTVSITVCSRCPPVTFFNYTTALVTSSDMPNNAVVHFFDLGSWPPLITMNRILSDQPRAYWYDDLYIQQTPSVTITVTLSPSTPTVSPTSSTDARQDDGLSHGAIAGIVVGIVCTATLLGSIAAIIIICVMYHKNANGEIRHPLQAQAPIGIPDENAERLDCMVPG